jgi:urease accessory protein
MTSLYPLPTAEHGMAMQRTRGAGRLSAKLSAGQSRIDRLFQEGSARIRLPRVAPGAPLEAVLINTAGGLTGGDRMDWRFEAGEGAALLLATQACEKTYKARGDSEARVSVQLNLNIRKFPGLVAAGNHPVRSGAADAQHRRGHGG